MPASMCPRESAPALLLFLLLLLLVDAAAGASCEWLTESNAVEGWCTAGARGAPGAGSHCSLTGLLADGSGSSSYENNVNCAWLLCPLGG